MSHSTLEQYWNDIYPLLCRVLSDIRSPKVPVVGIEKLQCEVKVLVGRALVV